MTLRAEAARPHDLPGALELLGRSGLSQHGVAERWGHYFVVREDDGRVIGVAGLEVHGEFGLLRSVAVDDDYRGQGLAAALVEATLERARRLGLRKAYLFTTNAQHYFGRHGFTPCAREDAPDPIRASWQSRDGCPAGAVVMTRPVD